MFHIYVPLPTPRPPRIQDAPQNLSEIPNVSLPQGTCFFGWGEVSKMSFLFGRWFSWNIMTYQGCMLTLSGWRERICQSCVDISLVPNISQINDHNMQDLIGKDFETTKPTKISRKSEVLLSWFVWSQLRCGWRSWKWSVCRYCSTE